MVVKIDNPTGKYYGGLTAAPVTRTMLQQALASRRIGIDRSRLTPAATARSTGLPEPAASCWPVSRVVLSWPYQADRLSQAAAPVPDVSGQPVREAALALHRRGFRVNLRGVGAGEPNRFAAGRRSRHRGRAVTVWAD